MRVAVAGCGRMGKERTKAIKSFGVNTIVLFDEDHQRAESLAQEYHGANSTSDPGELFRQTLDALFICIPPYVRGELEIKAINSGVPFFVEKPIGVTAGQAQPILEQLESRSVLNAVGYMNRYRNSVLHARRVLAGRSIIGIAAHWVGKRYTVPWWCVPEQSGGPFNEQATHLVDLFRFLTGKAEPLYATARSSDGIETTVFALLRLGGDGVGNFLYSCEAKDKDIMIAIETSEGVLELRGWDLELVRNTIDGSLPEAEVKPIFEKETHAFLSAVTTGNVGLILADFRDAYSTQLAMDRTARMMRSEQQRAMSV